MKMKTKRPNKVDIMQYDNTILFNTKMRKTFVEGILQDAKGYFESKTDGKVEVTYEDIMLKNHEFGFKMHFSKGKKCTKQMFNEASNAFVNVMQYMFSSDIEHYDLTFTTQPGLVELEFVSNW